MASVKLFVYILEDDKRRKYLFKEEIILMPCNKKPIYKGRVNKNQKKLNVVQTWPMLTPI